MTEVKPPAGAVERTWVTHAVPSRSVPVPADPVEEASGARPPAARDGSYVNPVLSVDGVDHGDPFVLEFCGEYVLYHSGADGVQACRSSDLVHWSPVGRVLAPQGSAWAEVDFRAPEVVREGDGFVMYVAATVPGGTRRDSGRAAGADGADDARRRQGVARSATPYGPFVLDPEPLLDDWAVDAHPFTDDDGSRWLFRTVPTDGTDGTVGTSTGTGTGTGTVVRRLDGSGRPVGDEEPVCSPTEPWEGDAEAGRYRAEAAVVLKRAGWYHQLYSGGSVAGPGCVVGVARAPAVRGPWTKDPRGPVLVSGRRITGPGAASVVVGPDGATPYAVLHGHDGDARARAVHLERLRWAGDGPRIGDGTTLPGRPGEGPLPVPAGPVHDPAVAHVHVRAWVEAAGATVLGVPVVLPGRRTLLTAGTDGSTVVVRVDGVVVARVDTADLRPGADPLRCDGVVHHAAVTSRLDDEHRHVLDAGTSRTWAWGGSAPATAEVAVRGRAVVRFGDAERPVDTVAVHGGTGFTVVVLDAPSGADRLTVTALTDCEVADVVLAARPAPARPVPVPRSAGSRD